MVLLTKFYNKYNTIYESEVCEMNCTNCNQEIPDGSRFCPHCGAMQPEATGADHAQVQADTAAQPDGQYQSQGAQYQDTQNYGAGSQNTSAYDYQNNQYQTPPVYQSSYEPEKPINWVPYLVLSIITTVCCCLPFGIVGIVYAAKINSAVNTGDYAEAERAARTAKIWIIVSAVVGVLVNIVFVIMTYAGIFGSYYYYY